MNIQEDYVSFETAKLLKEKGFNELCDKKYYGDDCSGPSYIRERWEDGGNVCPMSNSDLDDGSKYADISAPTLQMAMKWLREVKGLYIDIIILSPLEFNFSIVVVTPERTYLDNACEGGECYLNHQDVCEAAIKYCLENLI